MTITHYRHVPTLLALLLLAVSCGNGDQTAPIPSVVTSNTPVNTPTREIAPSPPQQQTPTAPLGTPTTSVPAAAVVNDQLIPLQEFESQVALATDYLSQQQNFDPDTEEGRASLVQLRRQVLDWMIDQTLIEQAAEREGISISQDKVEEETVRLIGDDAAQFEEWLQANGLTHESFKAQLHRELLGAALQERVVGSLPPSVEQVHARHILVMSEAEAMEVLIKLRSGESFATLAQQYSQDMGSRDIGGDLGFFPRGVMLPEIEATAFGLEPGQTSGILKTAYGYHVVEVVEKDPSREVSEEMLATWRNGSFLKWLESQRAAATIRYLPSTE
jgi:parvulin-like peptidyl-prolyl isomerase